MTMKKRGGLVYSTGKGRICPGCGWPADRCACSHNLKGPADSPTRGDGVIRVSRQTKGRKGKGVTVIAGIPLSASDLSALATELKKKCGSGGTLRDGVIEIQGDHRDLLVGLLQTRGWTVKRAGG
jgi:translation initiation factor 1